MKNIILTLSAFLIINCAQLIGAGGHGAAGADVIEYVAPHKERVRRAITSQEALNEFVVERATHIYSILNSGTFRYEEGREPFSTPSVLWTSKAEIRILDYPGHEPSIVIDKSLTASSLISPAIALRQLLKHGGVIECGIALDLVRNLIFLEIVGDELFDAAKGMNFSLPSDGCFGISDLGQNTPINPGGFVI